MKKYSLVLLDFAKQDAKEINRWYKSIRKELAKRFTSDLKNTLFSIERLPTAYAIRYEKVRFANLDIFPYLIEFFINEDNSIVVIAILYNGRDPKFFKEKSDAIV